MKKFNIYTEEQLKNIFDNNNAEKAMAGDILVIKEKLSLTEDIIVNIPVVVHLEAGNINLKNHLIIQENLEIM